MAEKQAPLPSSPGSVKGKLPKPGLTDIIDDNVLPIDPEKFTPDNKQEFEAMMQQARDQYLSSFMQTRKGTLVQKYKLKLVADSPGTGSSKDREVKQAPDGSAQPNNKGATGGSIGNQGDNPQEVHGAPGDAAQGPQGGNLNQNIELAQDFFNNFQDWVDYAVHHALINQSGVLVNTMSNMNKTIPLIQPVMVPEHLVRNIQPNLHNYQGGNLSYQYQPPSPQAQYQPAGSAQQQFAHQFGQFEPMQQQPQGAAQQRPWADVIADVMREQFGLRPKETGSLYRQPYPEWFERVPLPNRFKIPDFSKFSGQEGVSTYEHISRYLAQCGEASAVDALRVRMFRLSLSGSAFTWFSSLPYGSVNSWADLEKQFHSYFYNGVHEMKLSDLTAIKQRYDEPVHEYIQRFREVRNKCFSLSLTDAQLADLAFQGMIPPIREKFSSEDFNSLSHLIQKVTLHEHRSADVRRSSRKVNHVCPYTYGSDDEDDDSEIAAVEWVRSKKVAIEGGKIKFDDSKKPMKVDGNPFPDNMVHTASQAAGGAKIINKYQRKYDKQQARRYEENNNGFDPHWDCEFFRFFCNEGMRLPSIENCPGCSDVIESSSRPHNQGDRPRQTRLPVHQRLGPMSQDHGQEDEGTRKNQWCPSGIYTKNQKRRVQRLRSRERFQEVEEGINHRLRKPRPRQVWRVKNQAPTADDAAADEAKRLAKGKSVVTAPINMVFTLPAEFGINQADVDEVEEESAKLVLSPEQAVFEKPEGTENRHIKPLYVNGYVNGKPMSKMMVDGGAAVNLMPYATFRKLGRNAEDLIKTNMVLKDFGGNPSETKGVLNVELTVGSKTIPTTFFVIDGKGSYSLLLGRYWIHANCCIPSTMHQCLIQWQGDKIEVVPADSQSKMENPSYYFEGVVEGSDVYAKDTVDDLDDKQGQGFMSDDDLEEIDIGPGDQPRPTFISKGLSSEFRTKLIELLKEFRDCFAWEYYEMPGLSRSIVEHRLPIKTGVRPHQQPPRRCKADMLESVKAEIKRLYDAGFIRPCRYAEWVSSIVPVIKKNGKVRVCIDFRDLNKATPKDEYPMPVADQLVDAASGNKILSFMDGNAELDDHIADLRKVFERTRKYGLKMNPTKCAFGVSAGQFLGFLVHERGIEAIKGQAIADFIVEHHDDSIGSVEIAPWTLFFDGSVRTDGCGIDLVIISPRGACFEFAYTIKPYATNNQAECEAVLKGLQLLKEVEADTIEIMGDSLLVISQLAGEYECKNDTLIVYNEKCLELMKEFRLVTLKHVSREQNLEANDLAQGARADDWRYDVHQYLSNPSQSASRKLRYKALKYTLLGDELYYRTIDGVLLKCLSADQAKVAIGEVHEGICGTHQSAHKMKWLLRRTGYFWLTMLEDCFRYYKGCQDCQKFGAIQRAPASAMNPIIKPWPFRGWGIDMIGMINPPSSKGHKYILVATDYFTKWVEAIPLKKVDSGDAIQFVQEHIIYRFGLPQTITMDQGSIFVSDEFVQFADSMGIKLLNSSPYYAQANGQAEASNKSLIKLIKRKISDYPRQWHTRLAEAFWSYRMACHGSIQVPPYKLVYGHEAVLPWEVRIGSRQTELQNDLTADEYYNLMADEREDLVQSRLRALAKVTKDKERVARHYNKKVVPKDFSEGELVWKLILLIGTRDNKFDKWSPNWGGPF
uniref:Retrotransposon protein, putative, unclassified n=1 Tax=Oryza sativa subsp. japonica TaxID=39947 RepID=Q2R233_ORYSJ|nr:retrotransposon protein, putative, unclassified [Oryza sativa Japonica Group]